MKFPGLEIEEFVTLLTNDLSKYIDLDVLILDDFHVITNVKIIETISLFLEVKPIWLKIILLTREDPALPLARWLARGQLVELRQEDLRFTLIETI